MVMMIYEEEEGEHPQEVYIYIFKYLFVAYRAETYQIECVERREIEREG